MANRNNLKNQKFIKISFLPAEGILLGLLALCCLGQAILFLAQGDWKRGILGLIFLFLSYEFTIRAVNVLKFSNIKKKLDRKEIFVWKCPQDGEVVFESSLQKAKEDFRCQSCLKRKKPEDVSEDAKLFLERKLV